VSREVRQARRRPPKALLLRSLLAWGARANDCPVRGGPRGEETLRVLGIDPGSRFCGFGVVEDAGGARIAHVAHGVLSLDESQPIEVRLLRLFEGLVAQLERHRPAVVAIEDVFHSQNARSALVLGQARGVALLAAAQAGIEIRSFPPSTVKQAVTGSGRAEKGQVGRMVETLLGIRVEGRADASDALAVALCGALRTPAREVQKGAQRPARETSAALLASLLQRAKGKVRPPGRPVGRRQGR
jgi:crossover junction endodeoxyribonuclease RuvC